jgi:4-oxalocrotonate tautomerase
MSGDVPDVQSGHRAEHERPWRFSSDKEDDMPLIQVKVMAGVFTAPQKREMVERLSEALIDVVGEGMRRITWCTVEEIGSSEWGIGGQPLCADDLRALASDASDPG